MFGRKKEPAPRKGGGGKALMAQMGLATDDVGGLVCGDLEDDDDLEAELRALQDEDDDDDIPRAGRGGGGRSGGHPQPPGKGKGKASADLNKMIAMSMRDVPSDEDVSDTEDPDLLAELEDLTSDSSSYEPPKKVSSNDNVSSKAGPTVSMVTTLQERLENYKSGYEIARSSGDPSKARRAERGIKTLEDLMKQAKAGKQISEDDIPPVLVNKAPPAGPSSTMISLPTSQAPQPPAPSVAQPTRVAPVAPSPASATVMEHSGGLVPNNKQPTAPVPAVRSSIPPQPSPGNAAPLAPVRASGPAVSPPKPVASASVPNKSTLNPEDADKLKMLTGRRDEYKVAALKAKRSGDEATAKNYIRTAKQFELVIEALEAGQPVDLSKMPPPPTTQKMKPGQPAGVNVVRDKVQGGASGPSPENEEPLQETSAEDKKKLYKAPETAGSVLEALNQRLAKYKEAEQQAKEENNASKIKRQGRIVKQYVDAIKLYQAGKPVDFDELPCPPGFPPIPAPKPSAVSAGPVPGPKPSPSGPAPAPRTDLHVTPNAAAPKKILQKQTSVHSRAEQQGAFLEQRQLEFKQAAMHAKSSGDLELAKKYLRMAKGFDQMIEASKSGLPVNLSQVPPPPGTGDDSSFEFVNPADCTADQAETGDRSEIYKRLQDELVNQIKICESNSDHFTKLGDVSSATKFDKMCQSCRKDLDSLKNAYEHGDPVPRFHYETRQFSLVQCCTELGDNDLEVTVVRGLNYNLPSGYAPADLQTYVKYEFPFPDTLQTGETAVIKGTNCPEYNQTFKLEVNRKSRSFLRLLKSNKFFKFDVYYKRGFLKGDKLLGTANIKLQPLEDKCIYHDSYDLTEGRKAVGGKLEVKIRVRDPFVNKQVEEMKEKWLIIDQLERKPAPPVQKQVEAKPRMTHTAEAASKGSSSSPSSSTAVACISVLRFEKQQLDQQIAKYQTKLKPAELDSLRQKGQQLEKQAEELSERLKKGGSAVQAYVDSMKRLQHAYSVEAKTLAQQNNRDKLQIVLMKRKLVDKEIESLQQRLS